MRRERKRREKRANENGDEMKVDVDSKFEESQGESILKNRCKYNETGRITDEKGEGERGKGEKKRE